MIAWLVLTIIVLILINCGLLLLIHAQREDMELERRIWDLEAMVYAPGDLRELRKQQAKERAR